MPRPRALWSHVGLRAIWEPPPVAAASACAFGLAQRPSPLAHAHGLSRRPRPVLVLLGRHAGGSGHLWEGRAFRWVLLGKVLSLDCLLDALGGEL